MGEDDPPRSSTDALACEDELLLLDGEHFAANDSSGLHPTGRPDDGHHQDEDAEAIAEPILHRATEEHHRDQKDRQKRKRQEEVGDPHQNPVERLEVARNRPDHRADNDRDGHRDKADKQRDATSEQRSGEGIPAEVVGPHQMWPASRLVCCGEVWLRHIEGQEHWPEEARGSDQHEDHHAAHRPSMFAELTPDVGAQRTKFRELVGGSRRRVLRALGHISSRISHSESLGRERRRSRRREC